MAKTLIALLGGITVMMGAIGSHALSSRLSPEDLSSYQTAILYQFLHVIVLLILNSVAGLDHTAIKQINWLFGLGILFFSGSIYLIKLTPVTAKSIWFVTPLGGLLLISGWLLLAFRFYKTTT